MAGKLITLFEAEKLTQDFSLTDFGTVYTYWNADFFLKLASQPDVKFIAMYNGLNDGKPCHVFVPISKDGKPVGDMALEFGQSCPPSCLS